MIREHNDRMHVAWLGAQLAAYPPAKPKDFTKLDKLLISDAPKKKARRQSWQEQQAITKRW